MAGSRSTLDWQCTNEARNHGVCSVLSTINFDGVSYNIPKGWRADVGFEVRLMYFSSGVSSIILDINLSHATAGKGMEAETGSLGRRNGMISPAQSMTDNEWERVKLVRVD